jgi:hypothetical protein
MNGHKITREMPYNILSKAVQMGHTVRGGTINECYSVKAFGAQPMLFK